MWRDYSVFGGVLRSALEFPELPVVHAAAADWTLSVGDRAPDRDLSLLGTRQVRAETYHLWQYSTGYRLSYSHAGLFDLDLAASMMTWYPEVGGAAELARAIVIGPLFALLLETQGLLCLHGSAVAAREGAIAFIGPKHHGKSTLALALTAAGCHFVSDDLVAVTPGQPVAVRPAAPTMRLWDDAEAALRASDVCATVIRGAKNTLGGFRPEAIARQPIPLVGVYVLDSLAMAATESAAARTPLPGAGAVIELAHQRKLADSLIGFAGAASRLALAAEVAREVPIWSLRIARNFDRLQDVVERILAWHGGIPALDTGGEVQECR